MSVAEAAARSRKPHETQPEQKPDKPTPTDAQRRARFEAAKQSIENSQTASPSTLNEQGTASAASTVMLSPIQASMLIGEHRGFSLLTNNNRHVERDADWTSSNPSVVEVVDKATIVAKAEGTAVIKAYIHGEEQQANIRVYPGSSLPQGTAIWTAPVAGTGRPQIVPAIP